MFTWMLLRMMLLLWMTSVTLQGGTGYKPQNPNGGAAQMSPRGAYGNAQNKPGYGGHPPYGGTGMGMMNQHALKQRGGYGNGNGYRAPSFGGYSNLMGAHPQKGYGISAGYTNGGATKAQQGYGGYANGAKQPNTGSSIQNMGYPNSGTKGPKPGYGAKAGPSTGQGAKPNGYGGYANGGAAKQPNTGTSNYMGYPNGGPKGPKPGSSLQNMGYPNGGVKGPKPGYGAKAGPSNGQEAKSKGSSLQNMGYPNGGTKGPKPGYGAKAGPSNGQGAKPNGSSLQNMGYTNGGTKGPKPGYGGYANGGASRQPNTGSFQNIGYPNGGTKRPKPGPFFQNVGYPNGGAKGPKPGYGAKAGHSNGQGAKPGYGVPGHMSEGPYKAANSGYMPVTAGNKGGKGPKGEMLSPEASSHLPLTSNTKGVLPLAEHVPNTGLLPEETKVLPQVLQQTKGQNLNAPLEQGKDPNSMGPQPATKPFMQGPGFYKPNKAYKPYTPVIPQNKVPKPAAPAVPQAILAASIPQTSSPQIPQTAALEQGQVLSQEQIVTPVVPQPVTSQDSISSPVPLVPNVPEMQQSKFQSNPALHQMKNPTATNPELTGLGQSNGQVQGAIPSKPDCGPGGQPNGQWVKLPSPGSGYPNGKEMSSQPGFGAGIGGYPAHGVKNGYNAGHGGYGNKFNKQAGPQGGQPIGFGSKGKSQAKYGIGGLPFGSPNGYQTNPSGQYGNEGQHYGAKPFNPQALGKHGYGSLPYNSQPLLPESVAKSPDFGGLPYNGQPLGYGGEKSSGKYGQKGLHYGGQPFDLSPDAVSGKYGNPAVSYELLGPVTDGQSVEENRSLEALHQGPEIDGQKSIDQFGDGEVPPHPDTPGAGEANAQSIDKYGTGDYTDGRLQPEVVSFPGVPTVGPAPHIPAVTSFDGSSLAPVSVPDVSAVSEVSASPTFPQPELPALEQQPAPPQQIHIQQHLKFHFHPQGNSQTGKEGKYNLNGFFGNKYQG
ncbi:calymmin [Puntigrus tetrazona]|uniref:calymmin n=1 Tax=Puntigrus tetrazona TaxID=1606681 RepID=UPI001C8A9687|nr:calymmin [Puntigrus tetrazona]